MLRLQVLASADLSHSVRDLLDEEPAVSGLAVIAGAGVRPEGDLFIADIAREAANGVVDQLRDLGVHHAGSIQLDPVNAWLSQPGLDAEEKSPGSSADSVVWVDVTHRAYAESEFNWTYLSFMTLAILIAAIAIVLDSQILVIGAMVLGPEFGPIAALGVALVRRRFRLFTFALRTLLLGFAVGIVLDDCRSVRLPGTRLGHGVGCLWPTSWHELRLLTRQVVVHRCGDRSSGGSALAYLRARRRVVWCLHLGDDGAGGWQHRARTGLWRLARGAWQSVAVDGQSHRYGAGGVGNAGHSAHRLGTSRATRSLMQSQPR